MFENLLKIQGYVETDLTDKDYEEMGQFIYHTIKNTINKLG